MTTSSHQELIDEHSSLLNELRDLYRKIDTARQRKINALDRRARDIDAFEAQSPPAHHKGVVHDEMPIITDENFEEALIPVQQQPTVSTTKVEIPPQPQLERSQSRVTFGQTDVRILASSESSAGHIAIDVFPKKEDSDEENSIEFTFSKNGKLTGKKLSASNVFNIPVEDSNMVMEPERIDFDNELVNLTTTEQINHHAVQPPAVVEKEDNIFEELVEENKQNENFMAEWSDVAFLVNHDTNNNNNNYNNIKGSEDAAIADIIHTFADMELDDKQDEKITSDDNLNKVEEENFKEVEVDTWGDAFDNKLPEVVEFDVDLVQTFSSNISNDQNDAGVKDIHTFGGEATGLKNEFIDEKTDIVEVIEFKFDGFDNFLNKNEIDITHNAEQQTHDATKDDLTSLNNDLHFVANTFEQHAEFEFSGHHEPSSFQNTSNEEKFHPSHETENEKNIPRASPMHAETLQAAEFAGSAFADLTNDDAWNHFNVSNANEPANEYANESANPQQSKAFEDDEDIWGNAEFPSASLDTFTTGGGKLISFVQEEFATETAGSHVVSQETANHHAHDEATFAAINEDVDDGWGNLDLDLPVAPVAQQETEQEAAMETANQTALEETAATREVDPWNTFDNFEFGGEALSFPAVPTVKQGDQAGEVHSSTDLLLEQQQCALRGNFSAPPPPSSLPSHPVNPLLSHRVSTSSSHPRDSSASHPPPPPPSTTPFTPASAPPPPPPPTLAPRPPFAAGPAPLPANPFGAPSNPFVSRAPAPGPFSRTASNSSTTGAAYVNPFAAMNANPFAPKPVAGMQMPTAPFAPPSTVSPVASSAGPRRSSASLPMPSPPVGPFGAPIVGKPFGQ